jgi:hypothetical protein
LSLLAAEFASPNAFAPHESHKKVFNVGIELPWLQEKLSPEKTKKFLYVKTSETIQTSGICDEWNQKLLSCISVLRSDRVIDRLILFVNRSGVWLKCKQDATWYQDPLRS